MRKLLVVLAILVVASAGTFAGIARGGHSAPSFAYVGLDGTTVVPSQTSGVTVTTDPSAPNILCVSLAFTPLSTASDGSTAGLFAVLPGTDANYDTLFTPGQCDGASAAIFTGGPGSGDPLYVQFVG